LNKTIHRCGYVAIIGRPNVGKSTLLNHVLGQKLSITSRKPQTTRHTLLGILSEPDVQMIFVDTPGIHASRARAINRVMNRSAASVIQDVDAVIFVVDRTEWGEADEYVASFLTDNPVPLIVAVNKVDVVADKDSLLPHLDFLQKKLPAIDLVPVSALRKTNLDRLLARVRTLMPENPPLFSEDQITDRSERFLSGEIIREKITRQLGAELPYDVTVEIEDFRAEANVTFIHALILVEREGQKKIIIGSSGERLKSIGQKARADIENLLGCKVMLKTWVKVRSGWSDDERALRSLGYIDET
jgi:GTP-binding protein Era